jgi:hypothetical protein
MQSNLLHSLTYSNNLLYALAFNYDTERTKNLLPETVLQMQPNHQKPFNNAGSLDGRFTVVSTALNITHKQTRKQTDGA